MPNIIRILIFTFFKDRCWNCFASGKEIVTRYEHYDGSWGCVEAEWECGRCRQLVAEKHYSPVYPQYPETVLGRVQFLQQELNWQHGYVLKIE